MDTRKRILIVALADNMDALLAATFVYKKYTDRYICDVVFIGHDEYHKLYAELHKDEVLWEFAYVLGYTPNQTDMEYIVGKAKRVTLVYNNKAASRACSELLSAAYYNKHSNIVSLHDEVSSVSQLVTSSSLYSIAIDNMYCSRLIDYVSDMELQKLELQYSLEFNAGLRTIVTNNNINSMLNVMDKLGPEHIIHAGLRSLYVGYSG